MRLSWGWFIFGGILIFIGVSIFWWLSQDEDPSVGLDEISVGETVYQIDFENEGDFEVAVFDDDRSRLSISEGQYHIYLQTEQAGYLWGTSVWEGSTQPYPLLKNAVIEVYAKPTLGHEDNWYGVMCRLSEDQHGYAFLISADGFWQIARTETLADALILSPLTVWEQSEHIKSGNALNHLQVYCVEDYLALYINGEFVGDYRDKAYGNVGAIGLLAGGDDDTIEVVFDDLIVKEAAFKNRPNTPVPLSSPTPTLEVVPTLETSPLIPATLESVPLNPPATLEVVPLNPLTTPPPRSPIIFGG
jgi:hypothetical protein